jgi:transcriptional regulator with XRE-family HTH domain
MLLMDPNKSNFANWLEAVYINWQAKNGRASIKKFAEYLDMERSTLTQLMNDKIRPGAKSLIKIEARFPEIVGRFPELFDEAGLTPPDYLAHLKARLEAIPEDRDSEAFEIVEEWLISRGWRRER